MTVHSESSNGFQEVIYQRALEFEMSSQGIDFSQEQEMPVYYKNNQIGMRVSVCLSTYFIISGNY